MSAPSTYSEQAYEPRRSIAEMSEQAVRDYARALEREVLTLKAQVREMKTGMRERVFCSILNGVLASRSMGITMRSVAEEADLQLAAKKGVPLGVVATIADHAMEYLGRAPLNNEDAANDTTLPVKEDTQ